MTSAVGMRDARYFAGFLATLFVGSLLARGIAVALGRLGLPSGAMAVAVVELCIAIALLGGLVAAGVWRERRWRAQPDASTLKEPRSAPPDPLPDPEGDWREAIQPGELGDTERFMNGEDDVDMGEVRHFLRASVGSTMRLANAYDEAANLAGALSTQWHQLSSGLFGEWHPDPFVRGVLHGEGAAAGRAASSLGLIANAMRLRGDVAERLAQQEAEGE